MSIVVNGVELDSLSFNGVNIDTVTCNGVVVFESGPPVVLNPTTLYKGQTFNANIKKLSSSSASYSTSMYNILDIKFEVGAVPDGVATQQVGDDAYAYIDENKIVHIKTPNHDGYALNADSSYMFYRFQPRLNNVYTPLKLDLRRVLTTTAVTTMNYMFNNSYIESIVGMESWDFSNLTALTNFMPSNTYLKEINLGDFVNNKITSVASLFNGFKYLTKMPFTSFYSTSITNMTSMLYGCSGIKDMDITTINLPNCTNMSTAFYGCVGLKTIDFSKLNLEKVTNLSQTFYGCGFVTLDMNGFNAPVFTGFSETFKACPELVSVNMRGMTAPKLTSLYRCFAECPKLRDVDFTNFNFPNMTQVNCFYNNPSVTDITALRVLNAKTFTSTSFSFTTFYYGCTGLVNVDLSGMTFSVSTSELFRECTNLESVNLTNTTLYNTNYMFANCKKLNNVDLSSTTMTSTNLEHMFEGCSSLSNINFNGFNSPNVSSLAYFLKGTAISSVNFTGWTTKDITTINYMLQDCINITTLTTSNFAGKLTRVQGVNYLLSGTGMRRITYDGLSDVGSASTYCNASGLFHNCRNLTGVDQSFKNKCPSFTSVDNMFEGSNITSAMLRELSGVTFTKLTSQLNSFLKNSDIESADLSFLSFPNVTSVSDLFYGCLNLIGNVQLKLNAPKVATLQNTFCRCTNIVGVDLTALDCSKLTSILGLCDGCSSLLTLNLSNCNLALCTNVSRLCYDCSSLTTVNMNGTKFPATIKNASYMFDYCHSMTSIDFSVATQFTFNVSGANTSYMFYSCDSLEKIYVKAGTNWKGSYSVSSSSMFYGCAKLSGAITYSSSKVTADYANDTTGYFTAK